SVGATNVQYSYTDPSGNDPAVCSFIVEVIRDTELPVITGNNDTLLPVNQTNNTHVVSGAFLNPEATDNAGVSSLTHDYNGGGTSLNGFTFSLGEHTITWTATDNFGNTSQFIQTVEITERFPVTLISDKQGDEICEGDNITFTATPGPGGVTPYTYTFYIDGTDITGATNEAIYTTSTLSDSQEVKVIATDGAGFTSENSITVSVLPLLENQSIYRRPNN
ncbi:MAG: HYR domain-containing protein, partial [Bacteroidota bacterium]